MSDCVSSALSVDEITNKQAEKIAQALPVPGEHHGIVYVLSNPAMPGILKIGKTSADVSIRMKSLYSTGVPVPFECIHAKRIKDYHKVEAKIHIAFGDHRINDNREFFRVGSERVIAVLDLLDGEDVTPSDEATIETVSDQVALNKERKRRSRFRFDIVDIKPGSVLHWARDPNITCVVKDNSHVEFEGQIVSLTDAALKVGPRFGMKSTSLSGPTYWKFGDKTLDELRIDVESGENAQDA
ncbi:GIY-YIG nuclease family protein [Gluconacetobacter sp. Hr-1-5]|uniref:GIY-YIG nuclease family protein n=1 Tax=Gluconacetobacter sp. Hr-1-5 TaxID=3395370 RepID=UPI003B51EF60